MHRPQIESTIICRCMPSRLQYFSGQLTVAVWNIPSTPLNASSKEPGAIKSDLKIFNNFFAPGIFSRCSIFSGLLGSRTVAWTFQPLAKHCSTIWEAMNPFAPARKTNSVRMTKRRESHLQVFKGPAFALLPSETYIILHVLKQQIACDANTARGCFALAVNLRQWHDINDYYKISIPERTYAQSLFVWLGRNIRWGCVWRCLQNFEALQLYIVLVQIILITIYHAHAPGNHSVCTIRWIRWTWKPLSSDWRRHEAGQT